MASVTSPRALGWIIRAALLIVGLIAGLALPIVAFAQTPITGGTGNFNANAVNGTYIVNSGVTRTSAATSGTTEAISLGAASGTSTLTVDGTVSQTSGAAGAGRGIRSSSGAGSIVMNIGLSGYVSAVIDDAIQGRNTGTFNLTNLGTLYSGPNFAATPSTALTTGRGLNLRDAGGGTIVNGSTTNSTALIRADGGDAVRVGVGFTFTNYGTLNAAGVVNDNSANNVFNSSPNNNVATTYGAGAGFSFEDPSGSVGSTNSSLDNYGTITGARHGVQSGALGSNLTVTNEAGGTIIGRNGSGVGFDSTETNASKITVNNYGTIRGDYAGNGNVIDRTGGLSPTQDGDGDGVDIDGAATIRNYAGGQILATGAAGYDTSGRLNKSEGISIGGGSVTNSGLIRGADHGIVVNNDAVASRSGVVATTITNNAGGTIEGQNGFAIRLENKLGTSADNDTIVNSGTIIGNGSIPNPGDTVTIQGGATDTNSTGTLNGVTYTGTGSSRFIRGDGAAIQMGEGDDTLTNTGTITGNTGRAVSLEGGNDTLNYNGGRITGTIDGGVGTNTLNLGNGVSHASATQNFQNVNVVSGSATLGGVVSGNALTKGGAGILVLDAANTYTGGTTIAAGTLLVNNLTGSGTGTGTVLVQSGAILTGSGTIAGAVTLDGILDPGYSLGTLTTLSSVVWDGSAGNKWAFQLGGGTLSDRLIVGTDFTKGTGSTFAFDFSGSQLAAGQYVLVDWAGTTNFLVSDFSYVNLGGGQIGNFAINGSQLEFTAIPEPSTYAALLGLGTLGFVAVRRRLTARHST